MLSSDYQQSAVVDLRQRSKVIANVYRLLSLSLIPTAIGAWVGTQFGFHVLGLSSIMSMVVFLAVSFGFIFAIRANANKASGVFLLLLFTGFMGYFIGPMLSYALSLSNGATLIAYAALGTGGTLFAMSALAQVVKKDLSGLQSFLYIGLLVAIIAIIANIFMQLPFLSLAISTIIIAISSGLLMIKCQQLIRGTETNYVEATLSIYIDLFNIFINLLYLLLAFFGGDD